MTTKIDTNNGMGLIRYILALGVVVAHFNVVTGADYYFPVSSYHAVGGFFALSGFLVYNSYVKSGNLRHFIRRRALKILPPYLTIVLLCAFLLGFTIQPHDWGLYFSADWFKYLGANLTFLNFLHPSLPGVFGGEAVNGSLWTIKIEWLLYISVPVAVWILKKFSIKNEFLFFTAIYLISALYRLAFLWLYDMKGQEIYNIMSRQVFGQLCYFYTGVMIYRFYALFCRRIALFLVIAILMVALSCINRWLAIFLEPAGVSILTIGISMQLAGWFSIFNKNNVSYEMYLFHMPIIRLVWLYREPLHLDTTGTFVLSIALITAASCICWFLLDKPILSMKYKPASKKTHRFFS